MAQSRFNPQNPSEFEDSLARNQAESFAAQEAAREQEYYRQLAEQDNRNRLTAMARQEITKRMGKQVARTALGTGARAGAGAAVSAGGTAVAGIGGTALGPVILVVLGIIAAVIIFLMLAVGSMYYICNDAGWKSRVVRIASTVASWTNLTSGDICAAFAALPGAGPGSGMAVQPPTQDAPPPGQDLVAISGVPVEGASNPQLRPCMMAHIQLIYNEAQKLGINFVITSAYRNTTVADSGSLSAHARGEAVDIALRPRGDLRDPEFNKKVRTLVGIAEAAGFKPPQGDTLDEYNKPTSGATAPHIHIEYNTPPNGKSYCTNPTNHDEYTAP